MVGGVVVWAAVVDWLVGCAVGRSGVDWDGFVVACVEDSVVDCSFVVEGLDVSEVVAWSFVDWAFEG